MLVHLIEEIRNHEKVSLLEAVRLTLNEVVGAYAILVIDTQNNNEMIAARKGSPLVIGIGKGEYFVASDASPIVEYTRNVVYLEDEQIARINKAEELEIKTISNIQKTPYIDEFDLS